MTRHLSSHEIALLQYLEDSNSDVILTDLPNVKSEPGFPYKWSDGIRVKFYGLPVNLISEYTESVFKTLHNNKLIEIVYMLMGRKVTDKLAIVHPSTGEIIKKLKTRKVLDAEIEKGCEQTNIRSILLNITTAGQTALSNAILDGAEDAGAAKNPTKQKGDDQPGPNGMVPNPPDLTAYVPKQQIINEYNDIARSRDILDTILKNNPQIKRMRPKKKDGEPRENRLCIHLRDWEDYAKTVKEEDLSDEEIQRKHDDALNKRRP